MPDKHGQTSQETGSKSLYRSQRELEIEVEAADQRRKEAVERAERAEAELEWVKERADWALGQWSEVLILKHHLEDAVRGWDSEAEKEEK